jgi:lysophospholipase L1-like esterase
MVAPLRSSLLLSVLMLAGCAAAPAPAPAPVPDPNAPKPIRASKIVLVGDSTTAVQGGWGGSFCAEHVTSFAACVNLARGGRSSGSYIAEGSWDVAMAEIRTSKFENTWILIQFGHNDQPGKPGRSTDLATEFPANLRRYVNEARAAGAKPVLITPLTRRMFKEGVLLNDLRPWAEAAARVAAELNVPLVDLNALSHAAIQAMGPVAASAMAQRAPSAEVAAAAAQGTTIAASTGVMATEVNDPPPVAGMAQPKLSFDYTHLGSHGADYFSKMVTVALAEAVPEMRPLLIP